MPDGYNVSSKDPNLRYYEPDVVLIQEDSADDGCIYVLNQGTLGVFKGADQVAEITKPDTMLGEMSALLGTTRTATIKTMEEFDDRGAVIECKVTVYTGGMLKIIQDAPEIGIRVMKTFAQRLQDQTNLHKEDLKRTEKIEKMNQKMRRQVRTLKKENDELQSKISQMIAEGQKKKGLLGRFGK